MGVLVGILNSRGYLCGLISAFVLLGIGACAEPDERLPWPTAQEEQVEMPNETMGIWKSSCFTTEEGSRYFELQMKSATGEFTATEIIHDGEGCKGAADDVRIHAGKISKMESLGDLTWKLTAEMNNEKAMLPGDLIKAEILVKIVDGSVHLKPICADIFELGDRIHKEWEDSDPIEWILEQSE